MPENVYEVLSLCARYWFTFLGVIIILRSFSWLRKDRKARHRRLKQLPDAGMIGEMVVIVGSDELPAGTAIPVPREGVLGSLRSCDLVAPVSGVAARHADFSFVDGTGLLVRPRRGCECEIDGEIITSRAQAKKFPMHHRSRLRIGDALLRLRVFAGLETERSAVYADWTAEDEQGQPYPQDWQNGVQLFPPEQSAYPPPPQPYAGEPSIPPENWQQPLEPENRQQPVVPQQAPPVAWQRQQAQQVWQQPVNSQWQQPSEPSADMPRRRRSRRYEEE